RPGGDEIRLLVGRSEMPSRIDVVIPGGDHGRVFGTVAGDPLPYGRGGRGTPVAGERAALAEIVLHIDDDQPARWARLHGSAPLGWWWVIHDTSRVGTAGSPCRRRSPSHGTPVRRRVTSSRAPSTPGIPATGSPSRISGCMSCSV